MSEFNRVAIEKVCWNSKIKYWDYMSAIKVWYNFQNDFNTKYMANNKQKKETSSKTIYNIMSYSDIFQNLKNALSK